MVEECVRQRGLHLLGRHSLVDDRDHHRGEDEAGQCVQEGQARFAPLHGVLGALGLWHGDLDHLLPIAVGHPIGLGLEAGAGAGRTCTQVPVGVAVLVRLHVLLHLQGLDHVQEPLPAVCRHAAQGWPREVLPGQADQVPAREVLQGLTVLGHGVLQQPVCHLLGGPVHHLLHGPDGRGSAVPRRRAHAARPHAGDVRGQTCGAALAPAARTLLSGALGASTLTSWRPGRLPSAEARDTVRRGLHARPRRAHGPEYECQEDADLAPAEATSVSHSLARGTAGSPTGLPRRSSRGHPPGPYHSLSKGVLPKQ